MCERKTSFHQIQWCLHTMVDSPEKSLMHKREHPSPHPIPYSCRAKLLVLLSQNVSMPVAVTLKLKTWKSDE